MSFILSKDEVNVAKQRLRITDAVYRGRDEYGRPFSLTAGSAIQTTSKDPYVRLTNLNAAIILTEGPASVHAGAGRYDIASESILFDGPIKLNTADGYHMTANHVALDLQTRQLLSSSAVSGHMPLGDFS
ncbi:MAG: LPS export ABC transporter periplasmic protein LptC, partial [Alphaproteobacteria bacterium]|nr:LPS export ABC transporter periplasmic protein LptC [Alphaproteobacteria bacterium]